jgi:hypothetical protein
LSRGATCSWFRTNKSSPETAVQKIKLGELEARRISPKPGYKIFNFLLLSVPCLTCFDASRRRRRAEQERKESTFITTRLSRNGVKNVLTYT